MQILTKIFSFFYSDVEDYEVQILIGYLQFLIEQATDGYKRPEGHCMAFGGFLKWYHPIVDLVHRLPLLITKAHLQGQDKTLYDILDNYENNYLNSSFKPSVYISAVCSKHGFVDSTMFS